MKKALKILAWIAGTFVALLVLATLVLPLVFDPNKYKDDIARAVKQATGRELKIEGKIGWTVFPRLGISVARIELGNAPGFGAQPFAQVQSATVRIALLPLLVRRVNVDTVVVDGLVLNLAKDAAGRTNWDDLTHAGKPAPTPAPAPAEKPTPGEALAGVAINGIEVEHGSVNFHDAAQNATYSVHDIDLSTGRIASGAPVDLRLSLALRYDKPVKQAKLALKSTALLAANSFALNNIDLKLDDSRLTGNFSIPDLQKLALRFELTLDALDLDRYLPSSRPPAGAPAKPADAAATAAPAELPLAALRSIDADGKLRIGKLKSFGIRTSDIALDITAHQGLIALAPAGASLYGGTYSGRTTLDARGKTPQWQFDERLEKIQLGPFLKDAQVFDRFSGEANIALKLSAAGAGTAQIERTLNGTTSVAIRDGAMEGIDIEKMESQIKQARKETGNNLGQLLKALPELKIDKNDKTKFSKLSATANVANGVVSNDDLAIEAPHVRVAGRGKIDLVAQRFDDYTLRVGDVPLIISGALSEPRIHPDWNAIGKDVIKEKQEDIKEKLKEHLFERLKKR